MVHAPEANLKWPTLLVSWASLWRTQSYVVYSPLPKSEGEIALSDLVRDFASKVPIATRYSQTLTASREGDVWKIRLGAGRNAWHPVALFRVSGDAAGCAVTIASGWPIKVRLFTGVWLSTVGAVSIALLVNLTSLLAVHKSDGSSIATVLIPLAMLLGGFILPYRYGCAGRVLEKSFVAALVDRLRGNRVV